LLKRYFIRPTTVDRIRASWLGEAIENYVVWLAEQKYAPRNVAFRVPVLVRFGEFAQSSGANKLDELPAHIEPFIEDWLNRRKQGYSESQRSVAARELRNPIRQLLHLILPNHGKVADVPDPFVDAAPGFFDYLLRERGLREATLVHYRHYLQRLQDYLRRIGRPLLPDLPPTVITALITESGKTLDKRVGGGEKGYQFGGRKGASAAVTLWPFWPLQRPLNGLCSFSWWSPGWLPVSASA
jgi:hypothetical protein